jgi:hypothetical protein
MLPERVRVARREYQDISYLRTENARICLCEAKTEICENPRKKSVPILANLFQVVNRSESVTFSSA